MGARTTGFDLQSLSMKKLSELRSHFFGAWEMCCAAVAQKTVAVETGARAKVLFIELHDLYVGPAHFGKHLLRGWHVFDSLLGPGHDRLERNTCPCHAKESCEDLTLLESRDVAKAETSCSMVVLVL